MSSQCLQEVTENPNKITARLLDKSPRCSDLSSILYLRFSSCTHEHRKSPDPTNPALQQLA
jgi:hypothetical protein